MIFYVFEDEASGCISVVHPDHAFPPVVEPSAVHVYCIRANTWSEVMTAHHIIQGWEPYVPMPD